MEELKQYVHKTKKEILILGIFAVVFAIAAVVLFIRHQWILFAAMLFCAIALYSGATNNASVEKKFFDGIENSSEKDAILSDFAIAKPCANDEIRMGEKYIFMKKVTRFLAYKDIVTLKYFETDDYQTNKTKPGIAYILSNGEDLTLCDLYGVGTKAQAQEIFEIAVSKNPNITIIA